MPCKPVFMVIISSISKKQPMHNLPKFFVSGFNSHMEMIRHKADGMNLKSEQFFNRCKALKKLIVVISVLKYSIPPVSAAHDMISCSRVPNTFLSGQVYPPVM